MGFMSLSLRDNSYQSEILLGSVIIVIFPPFVILLFCPLLFYFYLGADRRVGPTSQTKVHTR